MAKPYNTSASKKSEVRTMFNHIAPHYDLLNHTLSFQIDKLWRKRVVKIARNASPQHLLDVATGTGDLAIMLSEKLPQTAITAIDLSEGMLKIAKKKVQDRNLSQRITLQQGDCEHLTLESQSMDLATVAFGVRNFGDLEKGLAELERVLRKGGTLVILEFSRPRNPIFRWCYELYSYKILPWIGGLISHDKKAYEYLPVSVGEFPAPEKFMALLEKVGFHDCKARSQSFGIAQIYTAHK